MTYAANELLSLDAIALSACYDRQEVSPIEVMRACLARIERSHATLNALVTIDADGAMQSARSSEKRMMSRARFGPLDGVPLTVKDNLFVRGMPATWGSRLYENFVPDHDDIAVERLRSAGACIVGKTNTPELALSGRTDNFLFGATRNPVDISLTPGGSSGGAVAATAAGLAPLALATDAGGSTRLPASYTGLFGLRPTSGRIPRRHGFPALAHDFQVVGLVTRTARDLAALFRCVSGPDPRDRLSWGLDHHDTMPLRSPARICLVTGVAGEPVDPQVRSAVTEAVSRLDVASFHVEEGTAPFDIDEVRLIWSTLSAVGAARAVSGHSNWRNRVTPDIAKLVEAGLATPATDYLRALDRLAEFRAVVRQRWGEADFIVTPTAAVLPWPVGEPHARSVDGHPGTPRSASIFSTWVNAADLPAISMPLARTSSGLPVGVQWVARAGRDLTLLQAALAACPDGGSQTVAATALVEEKLSPPKDPAPPADP